ncbi:MAG: hypothetical protein ABW277_15540 [Longimicrobiaceae bacterium]
MATSEDSMAYAHPPCTNEEAFRALAVVMPNFNLEHATEIFPGPPDDPFQGHVTTDILLIMCTFSDELAAKVVAFAPELEPRVRQVLSDPEKYLQVLRDDVAGQDDG